MNLVAAGKNKAAFIINQLSTFERISAIVLELTVILTAAMCWASLKKFFLIYSCFLSKVMRVNKVKTFSKKHVNNSQYLLYFTLTCGPLLMINTFIRNIFLTLLKTFVQTYISKSAKAWQPITKTKKHDRKLFFTNN